MNIAKQFFVVAFTAFLIVLPIHANASIDINTADHETLIALSGIGDVKATAIIDYRETNGLFETIEEIMNVSGIGTITFNNIKDQITVGNTGNDDTDDQTQEGEQTTQNNSPGGVFIEDFKNISVDAGIGRTVFVGADSLFEANVIGLVGEPLDKARVVWTFGNGDRKEGQRVLYNFSYPGKYVVFVDASSGKYSASDRFVVEAIPAQVYINEVTNNYIAIGNVSDFELDLGGWILFSDGGQFTFPSKTIILPKEEVLISNMRTGLVPSSPLAVSLLYPNGAFATSYKNPLVVGRRSVTSPSDSSSSNQNNQKSTVTIASAEVDSKVVDRGLITAPILAIDPEATQSRNFPSIIGWLLTLMAVVGIAVVGILFVRGGEYKEYSIEEVKE